MYPQPEIDIFSSRVYLSELPILTQVFGRNGYRMLDLRPGASPNMQIYWLTAVRVRDSGQTFIHQINDVTRLNAGLEERDVSQMPNYKSVSPLADLSPEERGTSLNPTPVDEMSPSESSEEREKAESGEES